ncbi:hypothetical protein K3495_g3691 [Podosphaera aphanis]|nr:hypothetical protein K3495_g3691 [Podosphaera aphanis]
MTTTIPFSNHPMMDRFTTPTSTFSSRKRKAEIQENNERLSKRLSLLNLERRGHALHTLPIDHHQHSNPLASKVVPAALAVPSSTPCDDMMQVDDSKHKVFIYDLDAELSDPEPDNDKLILLPDIEKHLRESRIPRPIMNNETPESNQIVLYKVPDSLTISEDKDSVRRAFIETRARAQAKRMEMIREMQHSQNTKNEDVIISPVLHEVSNLIDQEQDSDGMDLDVM